MNYPISWARGKVTAHLPRSAAMGLVAVGWMTLACVLPLRQVAEARAQAHAELTQLLTAGKPDAASVIALFDRANQYLSAAVTGPCLILATTIILLTNQLLKLRRRYNAVERDLERRLATDRDPRTDRDLDFE